MTEQNKISLTDIAVGTVYEMNHNKYNRVVGECIQVSPVRWFTIKLLEPNKTLESTALKSVGDRVYIDTEKLTSIKIQFEQQTVFKN